MSERAPRIGWIGTGVMGRPMAGHLLAAGCELAVHTRSRERAEPLLAAGATWAASPAEVAEASDCVFSIVGYPADVEEIHLGPRGTLSARDRPDRIVDLTTSQPSLAERIHERAAALGVGSVDAPVSGGDVGAREATLSIMVGADEADFAAVEPWLARLGSRVVRQGGPGAGQHAKMVNQILIAGTMVGLCEGLVYAEASGLDAARVLESVASGAAGSWTVGNLAPRMLRRDFEPGFYVEHFIKDLGIALEEAGRMGLNLPGLALALRLYQSVEVLGHARRGTQALLLALEALNGRAIDAKETRT